MRRIPWLFGVIAFVAAPRVVRAQPCSHNCDLSIRLQHNGCCPGPARPPHPPPSRCPEGQHRVDGHCCGEGQVWIASLRSCSCLPAQPNYDTSRQRCVAPCVPGATWISARNECACDAATPDYEPGQRRCVAHVAPPAPAPTPVAPPAPAPTPVAPSPSPSSGSCPAGMALIPAGTFWMGSPEGSGNTDEHPQHRVTVAAFCMDRTEVTVASYALCVSSGTCAPAGTSDYCNAGISDRNNHPINCVDWNQADAYCTSRGGRLPTEEEWEYAARGTDGRIYPWGNDPPGTQLCWNRYPNPGSTCPVQSYPAGNSPFGLFDMAGNVWEWTSSPYGPYSGGSVDRTLRVIRGGRWDHIDPSWVRAALRCRDAVSVRNYNLGFRCARGVL